MGYRCASEPVDQYVKKGGTYEEAQKRKCLCNGLMANIGHAQISNGSVEKPLITVGDDVKNIRQFVIQNKREFSALDVIAVITGCRT